MLELAENAAIHENVTGTRREIETPIADVDSLADAAPEELVFHRDFWAAFFDVRAKPAFEIAEARGFDAQSRNTLGNELSSARPIDIDRDSVFKVAHRFDEKGGGHRRSWAQPVRAPLALTQYFSQFGGTLRTVSEHRQAGPARLAPIRWFQSIHPVKTAGGSAGPRARLVSQAGLQDCNVISEAGLSITRLLRECANDAVSVEIKESNSRAMRLVPSCQCY